MAQQKTAQDSLCEALQAAVVNHNVPPSLVEDASILTPMLTHFGANPQSLSAIWPKPGSINDILRQKSLIRIEQFKNEAKHTDRFFVQLNVYHAAAAKHTVLRVAIVDPSDKKCPPRVYELSLDTLQHEQEQKREETDNDDDDDDDDVSMLTTTNLDDNDDDHDKDELVVSLQSKSPDQWLADAVAQKSNEAKSKDTDDPVQTFGKYDKELRDWFFTDKYVDTAYLGTHHGDPKEILSSVKTTLKRFDINCDESTKLYVTISDNPVLRKMCREHPAMEPLIDFEQLIWKVTFVACTNATETCTNIQFMHIHLVNSACMKHWCV